MKKLVIAASLALSVASGSVLAQGFNQDNLYAGVGINRNDLSGWDDATGFQIFGGYKLDMLDLDPVKLAVEVGYMDTGDFKYRECETVPGVGTFCASGKASVSGLWASAVASYPLAPQFNLLGRLGLDFGDDDGLLFGIGAGYTVSKEIELRAEYVIRDNVDSLQANAVYHF